MKHISELMDSLNAHFKWNKARIFCFANIILALFAVRTVNLSEIAVAFDNQSQIDSRYKRLNRFFALFKMITRSLPGGFLKISLILNKKFI